MKSNMMGLALSICALLVAANAWSSEIASDVQCTGCVDSRDIVGRAVTSGKIANGAVINRKLSLDAVDTANIVDGAVTGGKLENETIGVRKLRANARSHLTLLEYREFRELTTVSDDYQKLFEIGSFEKFFDASVVQADWQDHAWWEGGSDGFCDFQLRLNDLPMPTDLQDDGTGRVVLIGDDTRHDAPFSIPAVFLAIDKGIYTVSVWVRGSADECGLNAGNFPRYVIVRELGDVIEMPNPGSSPGSSDGPYGSAIVNGVPVR